MLGRNAKRPASAPRTRAGTNRQRIAGFTHSVSDLTTPVN
jgi:hypothetical protein